MQFSERVGLEEGISKAAMMGWVVNTLSNSSLTVWVAAGKDVDMPYAVCGLISQDQYVLDRASHLAQELVMMWHRRFPNCTIRIEFVDQADVQSQMEWTVVSNKKHGFELNIDWLIDTFFKERPWPEIEPVDPEVGLEEAIAASM